MDILIRSYLRMQFMLDMKINKGYQYIWNKTDKWKIKGSFEILNDISANTILVQFMEKIINNNHAVSIVGNWTFYSNY